MDIVWNGNVNKVPFEYVDLGHTFLYNNNIYMRVASVYNGKDEVVINAVNIQNGMVVTFFDDEYIMPIEGKFIMD